MSCSDPTTLPASVVGSPARSVETDRLSARPAAFPRVSRGEVGGDRQRSLVRTPPRRVSHAARGGARRSARPHGCSQPTGSKAGAMAAPTACRSDRRERCVGPIRRRGCAVRPARRTRRLPTSHEYFPRLLCNRLGDDVCRALIPDDREMLCCLIEHVCFIHARESFGFELGAAAAGFVPRAAST